MALASWLCTNNTKNMLVKIVLPGGLIELHDRPILVAEIMLKYPRCCVTHPHVFRQPWAVLAPDTALTLGQKFYVLPISTLRKLQRNHLRRSPSLRRDPNGHNFVYQPIRLPDGEDDGGADPACCFFSGNNTTTSSSWCFKHQSHDDDDDDDLGKESGEGSCFMWLMPPGSKSKRDEDGPPTPTRSNSVEEDSNNAGESPRRNSISTAWQPSLARISEDEIV
ncbi:hypothetical protein ACLOJK_039963 [Asimina triloba]